VAPEKGGRGLSPGRASGGGLLLLLAAVAAALVELLGSLGFRVPPSGRLGGRKVAPFPLSVSLLPYLLTGVAAGC
jgi:hypothetical protein